MSSNDKEIKEHILYHKEVSRKASEVTEKKEAEKSLHDSYIYEGFDEDGNRISESNIEEN